MGENICKQCDKLGVNSQDMQTDYKAKCKKKKKKNQTKKAQLK